MRAPPPFRTLTALLVATCLGVLSGCNGLDAADFKEHVSFRIPMTGEIPPQSEPSVKSADAGDSDDSTEKE